MSDRIKGTLSLRGSKGNKKTLNLKPQYTQDKVESVLGKTEKFHLKELTQKLKQSRREKKGLNEAISLVNQYIEKYKITPDVITVSSLITLAPDLASGEALIEKYSKLYSFNSRYLSIILKNFFTKKGIFSDERLKNIGLFNFQTIEDMVCGNIDEDLKIRFIVIAFINFKKQTNDSYIIASYMRDSDERVKKFGEYFQNIEGVYDELLNVFTRQTDKNFFRVSRIFDLGGYPISGSTRKGLGISPAIYHQ